MTQNLPAVPLRIFAAKNLPPTQEEVSILTHIASMDDVVKVVALPDLHHKPKLETPSSTAVATRNTVMLGLSSPSPNCSMALARTGLHIDDLNNNRLDLLFSNLAQNLPLKRQSPVLSLSEMTDVMLNGGAAAVERYQLNPSVLEYMDQKGNAIPLGSADAQTVNNAVPASLREVGGWYFALIGKGNHFLELQVVEELLDENTARAWGLTKGQVVVMYHADSGYLGAFTGRLYAHRQKNNWRGRLHEWQIKLPFQLTTGQPSRLLKRANYHLLPRRLSPIPAKSEEAQRALLALWAASNYAYANRVAILATLRNALHAVWGNNCEDPTLIWDAPHNSIRQETINDEKLWVHRHNATQVIPPSGMPTESPYAQTGHPVLLPGLDRTSSYLCVADEGAVDTLHSADHGAGRSAIQLGQPLNNASTTRLYTYEQGFAGEQSHITDSGLEEVLSVLRTNNIAQPVARLRPLAVLKGKK